MSIKHNTSNAYVLLPLFAPPTLPHSSMALTSFFYFCEKHFAMLKTFFSQFLPVPRPATTFPLLRHLFTDLLVITTHLII